MTECKQGVKTVSVDMLSGSVMSDPITSTAYHACWSILQATWATDVYGLSAAVFELLPRVNWSLRVGVSILPASVSLSDETAHQAHPSTFPWGTIDHQLTPIPQRLPIADTLQRHEPTLSLSGGQCTELPHIHPNLILQTLSICSCRFSTMSPSSWLSLSDNGSQRLTVFPSANTQLKHEELPSTTFDRLGHRPQRELRFSIPGALYVQARSF